MGLFFALISLYLIFYTTNQNKTEADWKINVVNSFVIYSIFIVITTEVLGFFHILNRLYFILSYILFWSFLIYISKPNLLTFKIQFQKIKTLVTNNLLISISTLILIIYIFIQGIAYPPNNWDSLTYHLPRIVHWIQNQTIDNFATNITRQLYSPPLSEYYILHFSLLSKNDFYSNSVQLLFLIGVAFSLVILLKLFTKNKTIIILGLIFSITIPEAVLEASSTQNDIIHSFFLLTSLYYGILLSKKINKKNAIFFGVTSGLCLLSKIIAYLYMPIIFIYVGISILKMLTRKDYSKQLKLFLGSVLIIILINLPFTYRKIEYSNSFSGTVGNVDKGIVFEKFSPSILLSTSIKNIALHLDENFVGNLGNIIAEKLHITLKMDLNEKGTNVFDIEFDALNDWKNHEDSQANFILILLFGFTSFLMVYKTIKSKKLNKTQLFFFSIITIQFLCFCAYIRWEPWNSRVHTPLFYEIIVFSLIVLSDSSLINKKLFVIPLSIVSFLYAFYLITYNYSRPFITEKNLTSSITILDSRYKKYFANNIKAYKEFKPFYNTLLKQNKPIIVGYISHIDGWEYPIIVTNYYNPNVKVEHILVENNTKVYSKDFNPDFIFSSFLKTDEIAYKNRNFIRTNKNNQYIQIFKKL
jgi:hypothetical protein